MGENSDDDVEWDVVMDGGGETRATWRPGTDADER